MLYWVTDRIGVKAVTDELCDSEYGAVIIDCRDLVDGTNPPIKLFAKMNLADMIYRTGRVIFQCQAGMSRSVAMAILLIWYNGKANRDVDDIYREVKEKVPIARINMDLLDAVKKTVKRISKP